jgi:thioredoxin-like negative regulator of GroEL
MTMKPLSFLLTLALMGVPLVSSAQDPKPKISFSSPVDPLPPEYGAHSADGAKAREALYLGDLALARRISERWLTDDPSDSEFGEILADVYVFQGRFKEAGDVLAGVVRMEGKPSSTILEPSTLLRIARVDAHLGRATLAQEAYVRERLAGVEGYDPATDLAPGAGQSRIEVAALIALCADGSSVEQLRMRLLDAALALDPLNPFANLRLASIYSGMNRADEAERRLRLVSPRGNETARAKAAASLKGIARTRAERRAASGG